MGGAAHPTDEAISAALINFALERSPKTFCPSEVARQLADDWRPLMPDVRRVASGLSEVQATQKGEPVSPKDARGPIRLGLRS